MTDIWQSSYSDNYQCPKRPLKLCRWSHGQSCWSFSLSLVREILVKKWKVAIPQKSITCKWWQWGVQRTQTPLLLTEWTPVVSQGAKCMGEWWPPPALWHLKGSKTKGSSTILKGRHIPESPGLGLSCSKKILGAVPSLWGLHPSLLRTRESLLCKRSQYVVCNCSSSGAYCKYFPAVTIMALLFACLFIDLAPLISDLISPLWTQISFIGYRLVHT
jgi:hypothetical protein